MHRVTSAAVLANPAAQQAAQQDVSDHVSDALSGVPELSDRFSEASELETQDDAPLLQDRHAPGPFDGVTKRTQDSNHNTGTAGSAVQEALAVMRLAAPVTIQVHVLAVTLEDSFCLSPQCCTQDSAVAGHFSVQLHSQHSSDGRAPVGCERVCCSGSWVDGGLVLHPT